MKFDIEDMRQFADRHRGKYKKSGPHWSTILRFPVLFDAYEELQEQNKLLLKLNSTLMDRDMGLSDYISKMVIELARLREQVREMRDVLNDWNIAWISDCITLVENGNVCNGLDEGLVMGMQYMTPLLEKTRRFLPIPPEASHE